MWHVGGNYSGQTDFRWSAYTVRINMWSAMIMHMRHEAVSRFVVKLLSIMDAGVGKSIGFIEYSTRATAGAEVSLDTSNSTCRNT